MLMFNAISSLLRFLSNFLYLDLLFSKKSFVFNGQEKTDFPVVDCELNPFQLIHSNQCMVKDSLLFFVYFHPQPLQPFLLTKLQILQDVLKVFLWTVAELKRNLKEVFA